MGGEEQVGRGQISPSPVESMEATFTFQALSCVIGVDAHSKLYFRTAFWQYDMTQGGKSMSHKKGGKCSSAGAARCRRRSPQTC